MNEIDTYLEGINDSQREALQGIREFIKKIVPEATEGISYGMPVFKYKTKYLLGYCGFKDHMSIFPGPEAIEALKDKLAGYKTSKGTVQFTEEKSIPDDLLNKIVMLCKNRIDMNA